MNTYMIGMIGATLTTVAFVPQVIKIWRSKSAQDLSVELSLLFILGTMFWIIYGIRISEFPVIISNTIVMMLNGVLLVFKLIYTKHG